MKEHGIYVCAHHSTANGPRWYTVHMRGKFTPKPPEQDYFCARNLEELARKITELWPDGDIHLA